eukprot:CAMPEP_0203754496 /NCGR_PEP_ID=MMETSP0098-20131031/8075_1 /ASSEMBLY_ACC=CAM_ASM_000208 /TAXON_ID=96639 /ORGANISM=" , Strain NY0313808BC1" /LENGTH=722 /DNA_ID=CAMNT_0050645545 /DNA_START=47 /DNA_END=2215 /DNA_ORIENTATION=+
MPDSVECFPISTAACAFSVISLSLLPASTPRNEGLTAGSSAPRMMLAVFSGIASAILVVARARRDGGSKASEMTSPGDKEKTNKTKVVERTVVEVPKKEDKVKGDKWKTVRIAFGTTTGTAQTCSGWIEKKLQNAYTQWKDLDVVDLSKYDQDNLEQEGVMIFVVSTASGGAPPECCRVFFNWLEDMAADFRVDKNRFLAKVGFAVIGLGTSDYEEHFCGAAEKLDELLSSLGAQRLLDVIKVDDAVNLEPQISKATDAILRALEGNISSREQKARRKRQKNRRKVAIEEENIEMEEEDIINDVMLNKGAEMELGDIEDFIVVGTSTSREMVTASQRKSLTKEGYKIIGSHSAVKLCRWTKHHLRGRGGCYKHTFYGITSYQCMEATPSLACANKCVFCWRHHKNPVGKEWRWTQDAPDMIVETAIDLHRQMIKQMKGVPGVQEDRYNEAFTVKHCALSLVGEPIMYPRINELCQELHDRRISTFLVTNAQFPQAIHDLDPVTQLYVSVDAATKDALKEVDRPLFKDFWERFIGSLESLRDKGQRTVYRLTLVKQWNMMEDELEAYARLIELGKPDLIEIKAVTFCGVSDGSNLTMENVPWHDEVRKFADALCKRTNGAYGTACEHVHSCCTLLARKDIYYIDDKWHTWIDYEKFHTLVQAYKESGGKETFTSKDYLAETPSWAVWGAPEEGFDPVEVRFKRSRTHDPTTVRPPIGLPSSKK